MNDKQTKLPISLRVDPEIDVAASGFAETFDETKSRILTVAMGIGMAYMGAFSEGAPGLDAVSVRAESDFGRLAGGGVERDILEALDARLDEIKAGVMGNLAATVTLNRATAMLLDDMPGAYKLFVRNNNAGSLYDVFARWGFAMLGSDWRYNAHFVESAGSGELDYASCGYQSAEELFSENDDTAVIEQRRRASKVKIREAPPVASALASDAGGAPGKPRGGARKPAPQKPAARRGAGKKSPH